MTNHPGERGKWKRTRRLLAAGLMLAMGYTVGVLSLGGCAGAPWPSNGKLPERVVDRLTECGKRGPTPLESVNYDLAFTVHVTENDTEARVDDVMLTSSTLHLPHVEACMTDALYGMRTPLEALALRRHKLAPDPTVAPETRPMLGQAEAVLFLEVGAVIVVGFAAYCVVVHVILDKPRPKRRPHPATPDTEAPPVPAPVLAAATADPTATAAPTATTVPTAVPVDGEKERCNKVKDKCIEHCADTVLDRGAHEPEFSRCLRACMKQNGC